MPLLISNNRAEHITNEAPSTPDAIQQYQFSKTRNTRKVEGCASLGLEEIERATRLPACWATQDGAGLVPKVLGNHRLLRRVAAVQGRRLNETHHNPVVPAA